MSVDQGFDTLSVSQVRYEARGASDGTACLSLYQCLRFRSPSRHSEPDRGPWKRSSNDTRCTMHLWSQAAFRCRSFGELRQDAEKLLACAAILPLRRRGHRSARDLAFQLERRELLDAHPVERLEGLDGDEAAVVHQPRHQRVHVLLDHRDLVRVRVRLGVGVRVRVRVSLGFTLALTLT